MDAMCLDATTIRSATAAAVRETTRAFSKPSDSRSRLGDGRQPRSGRLRARPQRPTPRSGTYTPRLSARADLIETAVDDPQPASAACAPPT
jgi:hypothetical protein